MAAVIRDVYEYHGARMAEEDVFGFGAGPCLDYGASAERREYHLGVISPFLEVTCLETTGVPLRYRLGADPAAESLRLRELLDRGFPVPVALNPLACPGVVEHTPPALLPLLTTHWVLVIGHDDADDSFTFVDNRRHGAYTLHRATFEAARYAGGDGQNPRGMWLDIRFPETLLPAAVSAWLALHRVILGFRDTGGMRSKGLDGLARFIRHAGAWPAVLTAEQRELNALRLMNSITIAGGAKGACRGLYAAFLRRCAELLDAPALLGAAARFQESAIEWQAVHAAIRERDAAAASYWARGSRFQRALQGVLAAETRAIDELARAIPARPPRLPGVPEARVA
ncbi:MAG: BtrH N-terminal domain-containing protein [Gemmatimonadaceae bacterium]